MIVQSGGNQKANPTVLPADSKIFLSQVSWTLQDQSLVSSPSSQILMDRTLLVLQNSTVAFAGATNSAGISGVIVRRGSVRILKLFAGCA